MPVIQRMRRSWIYPRHTAKGGQPDLNRAVFVGDDRDVLFRYTPTGAGATGPWDFLAGRTGYIQADAANVFDRLLDGQVATAIESWGAGPTAGAGWWHCGTPTAGSPTR